MLNGVITGKLRNLEVRLDRLRSLGLLDVARLEADWVLHDSVERALQVSVEIVIDICHRLLALAGKTPATNSRDAVEACVTLGALTSADPYRRMIGFRNLLVHRYDAVESQILADIVNRYLGDFDQFRDEVARYAGT